jgi:hypothetical protein
LLEVAVQGIQIKAVLVAVVLVAFLQEQDTP